MGAAFVAGMIDAVAITTTVPLPAISRVARATAAALRRQPVITGVPPPTSDSPDPFGEGSMSLIPAETASKLTGDRLICPPAACRGCARCSVPGCGDTLSQQAARDELGSEGPLA